MRLWVLVLLAACGGEKKVDAGAAPGSAPGGTGSAPAAPKPTLSVKLDGAPLAMERMFIKRHSPDSWRLLVGDKEGSCDELLAGVTNRQRGATSFVATINRRLGVDGKLATVVSDFWSAGHPTESKFGAAKLSLPADGATPRGKKIAVELEPIVDLDGKKKLEISGSLVAEGCGESPDSGGLKAPHPSTATLTIAGHKLPLRGAIVQGATVTLSTGPRDCTAPTLQNAQVILSHGAAWQLSGTWIGEPATVKAVELKHTAGAAGASPDGPTVQLALGGEAALGGYKVALAGAIEAIDCTPPPPKKP